MSDDGEGFLDRWSRRKREARAAEAAPPADAHTPLPTPEERAEPTGETAEEEFDVSSLPSLDSLGQHSDYTAFLRKGVPKALKTAALRKAWSSDPVIVAHRTPAEYDWDFNAPGYGLLRPTDDPKRMVQALFRHLRPADAPAAEPEPAAPPDDGTGRPEDAVLQAEAPPEPPREPPSPDKGPASESA